jgi:hypothetical protein
MLRMFYTKNADGFFLNRMVFKKDMFCFLWGKNWNFTCNLDKRQSSPAKKSILIRRSCDQPTRSRFSSVFLRPRANAQLVPKIRDALHVSPAAGAGFDQPFGITLPSKSKIQPKFSTSFLYKKFPTTHFPTSYFLHFPTLCVQPNL